MIDSVAESLGLEGFLGKPGVLDRVAEGPFHVRRDILGCIDVYVNFWGMWKRWQVVVSTVDGVVASYKVRVITYDFDSPV